ncbi:MAG: efflux RND transporter periplasmic adaptor subunit [Burkholderiaceae bacterium]
MRRQAMLFLSGVLLGLLTNTSLAGPGHDHGDEGLASVSANAPKRLPDGSVFLPKLSQRQLAVRTLIVEQKNQAQAFELVGRVVMDPNAGGKVQSMVAGRVEPGPRGLPSLGQPVRQGEVLAYVRPATGTLERANQAAQAAELRSLKGLAEKRLARLKQLEGSVPQKEIDAAEIELESARERLAAIGGSLSARETLVAPASGVIASANVVAGQVVDAREVLFEIVDPKRLRIEALAHDAALATNIASASAMTNSGDALPLEFIGAGRTLREQTVPIQFRIQSKETTSSSLTVGQPVKVVAQSRTLMPGVAVPAGAIVKNASNQDIVWAHTGAERFEQRPVRYKPLDASTVTVISGLKGGERIVVQGAPLLNQVR